MRDVIDLGIKIVLLLFFFFQCSLVLADHPKRIPILTYHNFDPTIPGSMTISTKKFEEQLKWLKKNGYTVIPLQKCVDYLQGKIDSLPPKSVVITADDGRRSVYIYMYPLVREYNIPVTLFIYPTAISNASYAMTWEQLKELKNSGQFDIQNHTYWHPNFIQEKKKLSSQDYKKLVHVQLFNSKEILEKKLGSKITLLAWPFGIYDHYLEQEAAKAGYAIAFSIDDRHANKSENQMAQPRYMIRESQSMKTFAAIVSGQIEGRK